MKIVGYIIIGFGVLLLIVRLFSLDEMNNERNLLNSLEKIENSDLKNSNLKKDLFFIEGVVNNKNKSFEQNFVVFHKEVYTDNHGTYSTKWITKDKKNQPVYITLENGSEVILKLKSAYLDRSRVDIYSNYDSEPTNKGDYDIIGIKKNSYICIIGKVVNLNPLIVKHEYIYIGTKKEYQNYLLHRKNDNTHTYILLSVFCLGALLLYFGHNIKKRKSKWIIEILEDQDNFKIDNQKFHNYLDQVNINLQNHQFEIKNAKMDQYFLKLYTLQIASYAVRETFFLSNLCDHIYFTYINTIIDTKIIKEYSLAGLDYARAKTKGINKSPVSITIICTNNVEKKIIDYVHKKPTARWNACEIPVVIDLENYKAYYFSKIPMFGVLIFKQIKEFLSKTLTINDI